MNKKRPLLLVLLVIYVFSPGILQWITAIDGHWCRPFIVWLLIIFVAFVLQHWKKST